MADRASDALALLAHELRTPLSTIVAAAAGLERGGNALEPSKQRALVKLVAEEGARLARLVDAVLTEAKIRDGALPVTLRETDIGAVATSAAGAAAATEPSDRSITHETTGSPLASADADRLRQVIDNLIDNALKHAAGQVHIAATREGDRVKIEVSDDGAGIPLGERQAVFEKFHRLDSPAAGSGLGLWLCWELVTRMNGTISVADRPGGACFVVELAAAG